MPGFNSEIVDGIAVSDSAGWVGTRGATGRVTSCMTRQELLTLILILRWAKAPRADSRVAALAEKQLLRSLRAAPAARVSEAFRGRPFEGTPMVRSPYEFSSNPRRPANRYNRDGESALYLGLDFEGIAPEAAVRAHEHLQIARFRFPSPMDGILDLCPGSDDVWLAHAMDLAERPDSDFSVGHRIADLVRSIGARGFVVPSVRGTRGARYRNLVIFDPDEWREWVDLSFVPVIVESSRGA